MQKKLANKGHALIIDQHTTYSVEVCRSLSRQGYSVDIFAEPFSPSLRSRFCQGRLLAPSFRDGVAFINSIQSVVREGSYDVIYLCSEEVLPYLIEVINTSDRWRALLISEPSYIQIMLSKHAVLRRVAEAGAPIPTTNFPTDEEEVAIIGRDLGFPLLIKGEKGEGSQQVRVVNEPEVLLTEYRKIVALGKESRTLPALQKFVSGIKYTVGGLFHQGTPLRVIAYRSELVYPPQVGATMKAITERPSNLLETAFMAFDALRFTGLGNAEFIFDARDKKFKLLEINPRVWGNIGFAQHAGVDLYTPYRSLADGNPVKPDLRYRTGVRYRRWLQDVRLVLKQPSRFYGFVSDCLNPQVLSDFYWNDPSPIFSFAYFYKKTVSKQI